MTDNETVEKMQSLCENASNGERANRGESVTGDGVWRIKVNARVSANTADSKLDSPANYWRDSPSDCKTDVTLLIY